MAPCSWDIDDLFGTRPASHWRIHQRNWRDLAKGREVHSFLRFNHCTQLFTRWFRCPSPHCEESDKLRNWEVPHFAVRSPRAINERSGSVRNSIQRWATRPQQFLCSRNVSLNGPPADPLSIEGMLRTNRSCPVCDLAIARPRINWTRTDQVLKSRARLILHQPAPANWNPLSQCREPDAVRKYAEK